MKLYLLFFISVFYSNCVYSQIDFTNQNILDDTQSVFGSSATLLVDIDGDGDNDVVSGSQYAHKIAWQENTDGQGSFGPIQIISTTQMQVTSLAAGDMDGDDDLDILATSSVDGKVTWFENDGQDGFTNQNTLVVDATDARVVKAADMDEDGDMDIVASIDCCSLVWYENTDGQGNFGPVQIITTLENTSAIEIEDLDNDGDLDIVCNALKEDEYIHIFWLQNNGGPNGFNAPELIYTYTPETNYSVEGQLSIEDIDDDGDLDILASTNNEIRWFVNDNGQGNFGNHFLIVSNYIRDRYKGLAIGDVDDDGDLDIVTGAVEWQAPNRIAWHENLDGQSFGEQNTIDQNIVGINNLSLVLINDDNSLDILCANESGIQVGWFEHTGTGSNYSSLKPISRFHDDPYDAYPVDLDNDGDLDIVHMVYHSINNAIVWYENLNGEGQMSEQKIINQDAKGTLQFGDMNGDSLIDIVASYENNIQWQANNGQGEFGAPNIVETNENVPSNAFLGDINGDGDLDIVTINTVNPTSHYIGWNENLDGSGNFGPQQIIISLGNNVLKDITIKDIDGDNNLDIIATGIDNNGNGGQIIWLKNEDSQGTFGPKQVIFNDEANTISVEDIDGDGDMDVVCGTSIEDIVAWFENEDGLGSFSNRKIIYQSNNLNGSVDVHVADIDGDGDMDILSAATEGDNLIWIENMDGLGTFEEEKIISDDIKGINTIHTGDINNDGDLDVLFSSSVFNNEVGWFRNNGLQSNRIIGFVYYDIDGNGCTTEDPFASNINVGTTGASETIQTNTTTNGFFSLSPTSDGTFSTSVLENINYFSATPTEIITEFDGLGNIDVLEFCIEPAIIISDLNIKIWPTNDPRPGFTNTYILQYSNVGTTTTLDGSIGINFDGTKISYIFADHPVQTQSANALTFAFEDLSPFESREITVTFEVAPIPIVTIGAILTFTATVNPILNDGTPLDNTFILNQTVRASYDPNDIRVLEGPEVYYTTEYLHYIIRFQNTGTAPAINVVIENEMDDLLDGSQLVIGAASHDYMLEIKDNKKVSFIFENINLIDSLANEPDSHGYISYKIKIKDTAVPNDIVSNMADIYFDYNPAIYTNTVHTLLYADVSTSNYKTEDIKIYPNPTSDLFYIETEMNFDQIYLYDMMGRDLLVKDNVQFVDLTSFDNGLYFVQILDNNKILSTFKVIKQ